MIYHSLYFLKDPMRNLAAAMLLTMMFTVLALIYASKRGLLEWASATKVRHEFILPQGESMPCEKFSVEACGLTLKGCGWGKSETFTCLTDVHYVGPVGE